MRLYLLTCDIVSVLFDLQSNSSTFFLNVRCPNAEPSTEPNAEPFIPETMINLEVWVPLGYNLEQWAASGNLEECGLLGPGGR